VNWEVFITCAVTGAGDTAGRSPLVPVAPGQIADAAIEAARAGAAIAHIHVRDPETGKGARDPELYRRVASRLGVAVTGCVVVDDHARNVRGARAAGAVVVHHHDEAATIVELEALFDLPV